jgi:hypothetical protein
MATTKIWDVRGWIGKVIRYAENPDKTENPEWSAAECEELQDVMEYAMHDASERGLVDVLDYAAADFKTEQRHFVSGINCNVEIARQQMILTKKQWDKEGGIVAYHGYQSFAEGEITPEAAHRIGVALAEKLWGDRFEVIVATHLNTKCVHNHFVINSISFKDGLRYYDNKASYALMRRTSDELCKANALSVISAPNSHGKHYTEWKAENEGQRTWRSAISEDVDQAIMVSMSFQAFIRSMKEKGYEVATSGKYMKVRPQGKERFVRLRSLGDDYSEEAIKQRILRQRMPERPPKPTPPIVKRVKVRGDFRLSRVTWKGLRALYFYYLYKLRKAQRQPIDHAPLLLREDLRLMDAISEQAKFLHRYRIDSEEQLTSFRVYIEQQISTLTGERKTLSNEKRHTSVHEEPRVVIGKQINELSVKFKSLRKDLKLCNAILERSVPMAQKQVQLKQPNYGNKKYVMIDNTKPIPKVHCGESLDLPL